MIIHFILIIHKLNIIFHLININEDLGNSQQKICLHLETNISFNILYDIQEVLSKFLIDIRFV